VPTTHRRVRIDIDLSHGPVERACLEQAEVHFARRAPGELVAAARQSWTGELFDVIIGPRGVPLDDGAEPEAPWACIRCANRRGFPRRGPRPGGRTVRTTAGGSAWLPGRSSVAGGSCRSSNSRPWPPSAAKCGGGGMAAALATEVADPTRPGCSPSWPGSTCPLAASGVTRSASHPAGSGPTGAGPRRHRGPRDPHAPRGAAPRGRPRRTGM